MARNDRDGKPYEEVGFDELMAMQGRSAAGLCCPKCGCADCRTVETRDAPHGMVRRRRECRYCGLRFTTYEGREAKK